MTAQPTEKRTRRAAAREAATTGTISLQYSLAELNSTQHRAGLAGLVLMTEWLARAPGEPKGVFRLLALDDAGLTLELDHAGLVRMFDELYAATIEEVEKNSPLKEKGTGEVVPYLRIEQRVTTDPKTGKEKTKTFYVYPQVVPRASMLVDYEPGRTETGRWVKLWRDMVWNVLRGVPAQRGPFNARAAREPTKDADEMWAQLCDPSDPPVSLPSTYYLGAQEHTAEHVGFSDRARRQFLLHFWPYAAQVYVPQVLNLREGKYDFDGYAVAIPDVSQLKTFCRDLVSVLGRRSADADRYRPREAVVDLAVEAALDLASRLRNAVAAREGQVSTADLVLGLEVLHVNKDGNNVRVYSNARVTPDETLLGEYERLRGRFWDPLFRRQVLLNVVASRPWFKGFDRLAETTSHKTQMIGRWQFARDVVGMFQDRREHMERAGEAPVGEKNLDVLVNDMVRAYVSRKAEGKAGVSWERAKDNPRLKAAWEEQKQRAANEAFLAVRSRTGADFVDYFVGTLCSKGQFLPKDRFVTIAAALRDPVATADVRTLTLLALSAQGWVSTANADKKDGE